MAATFYTEPVLTFGLDVFVLLSASTGKLVSLAPIYEALLLVDMAKRKKLS